MGRPRLSPEERETRRKARIAFQFSDAAYEHYDPSVEGYGNAEEWARIAEELFGKAPPTRRFTKNDWLTILGINYMPKTLDELKTVFRKAMMKAHPDHGGTSEAARDVLEAYARIKSQMK